MKKLNNQKIITTGNARSAGALDTWLNIVVPFGFIYEVFDREEFQEKDGRFLPALRPEVKSNGSIGTDGFNLEAAHSQSQSREWGKKVHIVRLPHPQDPSVNIVRKLSDSKADAIRQAKEEIPRILFGLFAASLIQAESRESSEKISRERNFLMDFVRARFDQGTLDRAMGGMAV